MWMDDCFSKQMPFKLPFPVSLKLCVHISRFFFFETHPVNVVDDFLRQCVCVCRIINQFANHSAFKSL